MKNPKDRNYGSSVGMRKPDYYRDSRQAFGNRFQVESESSSKWDWALLVIVFAVISALAYLRHVV